jgi:hypothetical protein
MRRLIASSVLKDFASKWSNSVSRHLLCVACARFSNLTPKRGNFFSACPPVKDSFGDYLVDSLTNFLFGLLRSQLCHFVPKLLSLVGSAGLETYSR